MESGTIGLHVAQLASKYCKDPSWGESQKNKK